MINYNKLLLLSLIVIGSSTQTIAMDTGRSAASSSNSTAGKIEYLRKLVLDDEDNLSRLVVSDDTIARDFSQNADAIVRSFPEKERKKIANIILYLALLLKEKKVVSETVSVALSHGADVDRRRDNCGDKTPLVVFASKSHLIPALEILIAHEACVDMPDPYGSTALMGAISSSVGTPDDRMRAITLLINAGANVNARDKYADSPLKRAERRQQSRQDHKCSKPTCKMCADLEYDKAIVALLHAKNAQR